MKTHRTLIPVIAATVALGLTACSSGPAPETLNSPSASQTQAASGTRTIVDHAGVEVTIPAHIERVAVDEIPIASTYLAYFQGEAPYLIGMSGSVVNALEGTVVAEMAPEMLDVDTSYFDDGDLNVETLLTLEPDVVLFNANNTEHREMFEAAGIPAVGFATSGDPTTVYADWLHLLEDVFDEPGKMTDVIDYGAGIIADAKAANETVTQRKNALIIFNYGAGTFRVAGETEFFGSFWLDTANADNAAVGTTSGLAAATAEQILAWEPDTVLIGGSGQAQLSPEQVLSGTIDGADLTTLKAVQEGRVYSNALGMWSWFTPNPDAPLIATWIGQAIYPEIADADALEKLTKEYYEKVYNFELSDAQVDTIYAASF